MSDRFQIKFLEWDSNFWRKRIAYITSRKLKETHIVKVDKFVKDKHIKLVQYLCDCNDRDSVMIAESNGFSFVDIRLTFERKLSNFENINLELQAGFKLDVANENDIEVIGSIAEDLYYDSRYFFDKKFYDKDVRRFYKNWAKKGVMGEFDDICRCLRNERNEVIGFVTLKHDQKNMISSIGLVGLHKKYHGKGLGLSLLNNVIQSELLGGYKTMSVVTQGRNYAAQRLYQRAGFLTKSTQLWYHKWI
jgi:dTDP-4-amino-4,6-dideoxy-D-galactose acyltransferase